MSAPGVPEFWTRELLEAALAILGEHSTIASALPEISEAAGRAVSPDALRNTFRSNGLNAPSAYLRRDGGAAGAVHWNEAMLDQATEVLKRHTTIAEATEEICGVLGLTVRPDTLRTAFMRAGRGLPSAHLVSVEGPKRPRDMNALEAAQYARDGHLARLDFRGMGRTEAILEGLKESLAATRPVDVVVVAPRTASVPNTGVSETVFFMVSDVHVGAVIRPDDVGGLNDHTHKDFLRKLERWTDGAIAILEERRCHVYLSSIVVALAGDVVDGHEIFRGQAWQQSHDVLAQLTDGAAAFSRALARLRATFPSVPFKVFCIPGNHGRIGTPTTAPFRASYDNILYAMLDAHLKGHDIPIKVSGTFFHLVEIQGLTHLLIHGDLVKSSGSPPMSMRAAAQKLGQVFGRRIDYLHAGHYHSESITSMPSGDVLINGSWTGTNDYSLSSLMDGNRPCQLVSGYTRDGLAWVRKIYLRDRDDMPMVARLSE